MKGKLPNSSWDELIKYIEKGLQEGYKRINYLFKMNVYDVRRYLQQNFLNKIQVNERGLIYIERGMGFSYDRDNSQFDFKSVGECWSWEPGAAHQYYNVPNGEDIEVDFFGNTYTSLSGKTEKEWEYYDQVKQNVTLHGYIHPKYVDWALTLYLCFWEHKNEKELRTADLAWVEITDITINDKKYHLDKPYLVKANADLYKGPKSLSDESLKMFNQAISDDKNFSLGYSSIEDLLKQGLSLNNIFDLATPVGYSDWFIIRYDNKYNLIEGKYNVDYEKNVLKLSPKNTKVLFGDSNNLDTWPDKITSLYENFVCGKLDKKIFLYNLATHKKLITDFTNIEILEKGWCNLRKDQKSILYNVITEQTLLTDKSLYFFKYKYPWIRVNDFELQRYNYYNLETNCFLVGEINNREKWPYNDPMGRSQLRPPIN